MRDLADWILICAEQQVEPWSGPRSLPVWVPLPEYAGHMTHDVDASYAAGLSTRPLAGLSREDEKTVLTNWHSLSA